MRIQHNSAEKIETVKNSYDGDYLRGCLFFGNEGHTYGKTQYSYVIEVQSVLSIKQIWNDHNPSEVSDLLDDLCSELEIDFDTACDLIDETESLRDERSWLVQQYQGIIANFLGYDCAKSFDEQGTVYIAYCVNKKMEEIINFPF